MTLLFFYMIFPFVKPISSPLSTVYDCWWRWSKSTDSQTSVIKPASLSIVYHDKINIGWKKDGCRFTGDRMGLELVTKDVAVLNDLLTWCLNHLLYSRQFKENLECSPVTWSQTFQFRHKFIFNAPIIIFWKKNSLYF